MTTGRLDACAYVSPPTPPQPAPSSCHHVIPCCMHDIPLRCYFGSTHSARLVEASYCVECLGQRAHRDCLRGG
eukprot:7347320-Heterocapsa_arctica.AAC.1